MIRLAAWLLTLIPWWVFFVLAVIVGQNAWKSYELVSQQKAQLHQSFAERPAAIVPLAGLATNRDGGRAAHTETAVLAQVSGVGIIEIGASLNTRKIVLPIVDASGNVQGVLQVDFAQEQALKTFLKSNSRADGFVEIRGWLTDFSTQQMRSEAQMTLTRKGLVLATGMFVIEPFLEGREAAYATAGDTLRFEGQTSGILAVIYGLVSIAKFRAWRKRRRAASAKLPAIPRKTTRSNTREPAPNAPVAMVPDGPISTAPVMASSSIPVTVRAQVSSPKIASRRRQKTPEEVIAKAFGKSRIRTEQTPEQVVARIFGKPVRRKKT